MLSHVSNARRNTTDARALHERERVTRDLHDTVIHGAQGLVLSVQAVAGGLPNSATLRRRMETALDQAERLFREARDRVNEPSVMIQQSAAGVRRRNATDLTELFASTDLAERVAHSFLTPEQQRHVATLLAAMIRIAIRWVMFGAVEEDDSDANTAVQAAIRALDAESDVVAAPSIEDKRPDGPVTARERSVLQLIGQGFSNKQIARLLNIAPETVKTHTRRILSKLGANTRAHAVACAAKLSLLSGG
jgi:ATP/maltotriose-dependent transcriptional regulator MalT